MPDSIEEIKRQLERARAASHREERDEQIKNADVPERAAAARQNAALRAAVADWTKPTAGITAAEFNAAIHKLGEVAIRQDLFDGLCNTDKLEPTPTLIQLVVAAFEIAPTPEQRAETMLQIIRRSMVRGFAIAQAHAEVNAAGYVALADVEINWTAARAALDEALR